MPLSNEDIVKLEALLKINFNWVTRARKLKDHLI
jgi:hypothetical protein